MIDEDITSISRRLHVSVSVLQKMPLDQISRLSDMIRMIPDIFQIALYDVSVDELLARLKSHELSGNEVHYKDLSYALMTLGIDVTAMPFFVREKFVGALSRNPKTFIISIPIFVSLYRFWCSNCARTDSQLPDVDILRTSVQNGRCSELVGAVENVLSPLLCLLTTEARNGEISEILLSSSLKRCGLILTNDDARSVWLHILMANGHLRADEIEYRENFISCVIISLEDVIRSFNPTVKRSVNRRHHVEASFPASDSVLGAIQRDTPAPLMRRSVAHRLSSIPLGLGTLPSESPSEGERAAVSLRYKNTSMHSRNAAWQNDERSIVSNTKRRVLSNLEGMDFDRKFWFVQLLFNGAQEFSNGYKILSAVSLFDALSKAGMHLRSNEKEEFWSETLSACRPLSDKGSDGPRDASVVEFIIWIDLGDVLTAVQTSQRHDDIIRSSLAPVDQSKSRESHNASDRYLDRGDEQGSLRGAPQPVCESCSDVDEAPDTPDSLSERGGRHSAIDSHDHAQEVAERPSYRARVDSERNTVSPPFTEQCSTPVRPSTSSTVSNLQRVKTGNTSVSADFSHFQQVGRKQTNNNYGGNQLRGDSVSSLFSSLPSANKDDDSVNCERGKRRMYQNQNSEIDQDKRNGSLGDLRNEGLTVEDKVALVNELQSKVAVIALTFRRLISESRLKIGDKKVTCDDFAGALLVPPLSIQTTPENADRLTRDILRLPADCDASKVAISYSDVTRYLDDNRYKYTVNDKEALTRSARLKDSRYLTQVQTAISVVETDDDSTRQAHRTLALERSILQKLSESDSIRRDRIRLLALTPLLRTRLRKQLNQGANGHSWDSSMDRCSAQEMTKLFLTADVAFSVEEGQHLQAICAKAHPDSAHSRSAPGQEVLLGDVILYLSELITRHAPKLHG